MIKFFLRPSFDLKNDDNYRKKIEFFVICFTVCLFLIFLSSALILALDYFITVVLKEPSIAKLNKSLSKKADGTLGKYTFIGLVILMPLLEELIFRFPLNAKKGSIALSVSLISLVILAHGLSNINFHSFNGLSKLFIATFIFLLLYNFIPTNFLNLLKTKYYPLFFYSMTTLFAISHITNFFPINLKLFFFYPIYVLPQFFMALFMGFLRVKYGLSWSWLFHGGINLLFFITH